ncbi:MAG: SusC/RagA family TonB-linked outer membrane protein, partial [Bacteroidales bacterium]|nr:SusC/RagA family TonB-linked outer membrane protein [Bacteroidales bacterium]
MKKISVLFTFLVFMGFQLLQAQTQQITGTITSSEDGLPVPGANIIVKGTTLGTVTDIEGNYELTATSDATVLEYSFIGLKTQEVSIDGRSVIDIVLETDQFNLDEVIVSGVASGTPRKKLSVSVAKVSERQLQQAPATSAAGALQGKVAGVTVVQASGAPGSAASIRLRGATAIRGSSAPLIIVDGVQIEGTLADIAVDDIQSMEVVKGAAASALYGSKAGNGVVVIQTKRGKGLAKGQTIVTLRGEYGTSQLARDMPIAQHHAARLADDWASETRYTKYANTEIYGDLPTQTNPDSIGILLSGSLLGDDDHYLDNPFGTYTNHLNDFFTGGNYSTFYASVMSNMDKTNFNISFEDTHQGGIVTMVDGFNRQNFRFNVDHRFSDKFSVSLSNLYAKSETDNSSLDFFSLLHLTPDMNLYRNNIDGSPYYLLVDQFGTTDNPLYPINNTTNVSNRSRFLGAYSFVYHATNWLSFDGAYSFEKQDNTGNFYRPYGYLTRGSYNSGGTKGSMSKNYGTELAQALQFTANFNKQFGDFTTKAKISYRWEDDTWSGFNTGSNDFKVRDVPDFSAIDQDKAYNGSYTGQTVAENIFGIVDVDYKAKYIGSFLYRYDGASQFGENERWQPYYRVSGAWRISEDFNIPGISELKIRAAHGTSGQRPPWNARYETYSLSGGNVTKNTLGNKDLKPSKIIETEIGLNVEFLKRFDFEFVYSMTDAEDQHYPVPLPASAGFVSQWQNMGTLSSEVFEATLGAHLISSRNFNWDFNVTFDRIRQTVTKLNVAPFTMGARGNSDSPGAYYIAEGFTFGTVYGERFLRSMDDMADQLQRTGSEQTIADYTINSDGYVIPAGTEGTSYEKIVIEVDENGNAINQQIGDANPDFRLGFANIFTFHGFTLYTLIDWKQGGDIYNLTNQWMFRDNIGAEMDMFGVPDYQKKTYDYYQSIYNVASPSSHFVEDGTYVKLRELSLYYSINKEFLGFFKSLRIGVIGRNLITWTNYSGYD